MKWLWDKIRPAQEEKGPWDPFQQKRLDKMAAEQEAHERKVKALLESAEFLAWAAQRQSLLPAEELDAFIVRMAGLGLEVNSRDVLQALKAYGRK